MNNYLPKTYPATIAVKITPNAPQTKILEKMSNGVLKIAIHCAPEKGKANKVLIKFFKKEFGILCSIKKGETNQHKILELQKL